MKSCSICKETKPLFSFGKDRHKRDGLTVHCKSCSLLVRNGYRVPARPILTEKSCSVCLIVKPIDQFSQSSKCKQCQSDIRKAKAALKPVKHRDFSTKKASVYKRLKRQSDLLFKLRSNIGTSIANTLANQGYKKTTRTITILGCSFAQFKCYLEQLFTAGMSWDNRDEWHLDHIIPVSFAQTEQELLLLNHYTNLRPIWKQQNLSKSKSIIDIALDHPIYKTIMENRISG